MGTPGNMATEKAPVKIAISTVGLDAMTRRVLGNCVLSVPGTAIAANIDSYSTADWEVARAGANVLTRVCFLDYDTDPSQAVWLTERLRKEAPDVTLFAVSSRSEPDHI